MVNDKTKYIMGLTLASFRKSCGMSRYALAKEAEVDNSWLRRFEQGKSGIRVETLLALSRGLNIPAATLITAIEKALKNPDKWLAEYEKDAADEE